MNGKKKISVIVPVFNEALNIPILYNSLNSVAATLAAEYAFEFLFTDNHSTDNSFELLSQYAITDKRIRVIRFSRNIGYQRSILTGYLAATGAAVIQIDADMQDPPEMIPRFLAEWESGYLVVYGVRQARKEPKLIELLRKAYYRLINFLSEDSLPLDAGDFRIVDRKIVEQLKFIDDTDPYLRGAIAAIGFNQKGIPYQRSERERGTSNFTFIQLINFAINGILNHSIIPLRLASYTGIIISLSMLLLIPPYVVGKIISGSDWPAGFTTITVLILFGIALISLFLGIIGEYLGRIYKLLNKRPKIVIEKEI